MDADSADTLNLGNGVPPVPRGSNQHSWETMVDFYRDLTSSGQWRKKRALYRLVKYLSETDVQTHFRAGSSMWLFFLSARPNQSLTNDDPVIKIDCGRRRFIIEYWIGWHSGGPCLQSINCQEHEVMLNLVPMLRTLWHDVYGEPYPGIALNDPIAEHIAWSSIRIWCTIKNLFGKY